MSVKPRDRGCEHPPHMPSHAARRLVSLLMIAAIGCALIAPVARAADFYVSPAGDDAADGKSPTASATDSEQRPTTPSEQRPTGPFASIARAQAAVRQLMTDQPDRVEPIVVEIADGVYRLDEPLRFTPADGGHEELSVTYRAASGGRPVISGGVRIDGWEPTDEGNWQVRLPEKWRFNELFVGGQRATRARFPNDGYLRVEKVGPDKRTSFTYAEGDMPWAEQVEVGPLELVFLHDWSISRIGVASIDPATRTLTTTHTVGPHANHYRMDHYEPHPRYFLENHAAFVDTPGEWFLDPASGVLTYRPRPGESIDNVAVVGRGSLGVVAPRLTNLLTIEGTPDQPVRNLHFEGLAFHHCLNDPRPRYAAGQAAFHEEDDTSGGLRVPTPGAVMIDHAAACDLTRCEIAHVGGSGIWMRQTLRDCKLSECRIADTGGNGVMIGEDRYRKIDGRPWIDVAPEQATTRCALVDSTVERVGQRYFGAVGVWVGMANHITVAHNEVHHTPYTGISVGWMWNTTPTPCHHNTIARNHIHHVMLTLSDGGGIYTLGIQPGTELVGNVIHDVPPNAGRAGSNGMFLDQGTTGMLIADSIIYRVDRAPLRFHQATTNVCRNNVLVVREDQPPYRYNRTKPEDILKQNDHVIPAAQFDVSQYRSAIDAAGPREDSP